MKAAGNFEPSTSRETPSVHYGGIHVPSLAEICLGGQVKFQRLQPFFPDSGPHAHILYLVSSCLPDQWLRAYWKARQNGRRVVWNHSAVTYRAVWPDLPADDDNLLLEQGLHAADYVIYQSRFARHAADRYLGPYSGPSEVLYNAVDTGLFSPQRRSNAERKTTVLLAGTQYRLSSLETALKAFGEFKRRRPESRLLVSGALCWQPDRASTLHTVNTHVAALGLTGAVDFLGEYTQAQAPALYAEADVLIHTRYDDLCPNVVIEALACGVPVVYTRSGGTPELVGEDAGIGVEVGHSWDHECDAPASVWADALERAVENGGRLGEAARQRAVDAFDLRRWIARHAEIFESVVAAPAAPQRERVPVSPKLRVPLELVRLMPNRVRQGESFNLQPDGRSALAIAAINATHATFVLVNDEIQDTWYSSSSQLSAAVRPGFENLPATHRVRLAELLRESNEVEFVVSPKT